MPKPKQNTEQPIPPEWRTKVCSILRTGRDDKEVIYDPRASREWSATFPLAWSYNLKDAQRQALEVSGDVIGKKVHLDWQPEGSETWAFWFYHDGKKLYGKVTLLPDNKVIVIVSAHLPNKGDDHL
ncbi:hypothetical protein [Rubritalea tangerina]|uniref:Uncharacterized protein n=1 Tax=Rubritalea tangerina TaxID=430798 RepID=A0ABW4Z8D1_9BACT